MIMTMIEITRSCMLCIIWSKCFFYLNIYGTLLPQKKNSRAPAERRRPLKAMLCVSEERLVASKGAAGQRLSALGGNGR